MITPARKIRSEKTSSQSGKNRGTRASKGKAPPAPPPTDESDHSDISSDIDEELDVSEPDDDARPQPVNAKRKTIRKPAKTTDAAPGSKVPPTMMILGAVKHLNASQIVYGGKNYFTPNSWMMFYILNIMHESCAENASLHKFCAQYHTGLSRIYYGIIWIIQVLRARHAAGALSQSEFQFLKYFETNFMFEELPIAGPLVVYFNNLCSFKPEGQTYDYVVPCLPDISANTATNAFRNAGQLAMPPMPYLIDIMFKFGRETSTTLVAALANDQYEPFPALTGGTLAGIATGAQFRDLSAIQRAALSVPGMSPAWHHATDTLQAKRLPIQRMYIPDVAADAKNTVKSFCGFDNTHDWFKKVITVAGTEAKYFAGSTTLANIGQTTGPSITLNEVHNPRAAPITAIDNWYPPFPFNFKGTFSSPEILSPDDFHIGALCCASVNIPEGVNQGPFAGIGSRNGRYKTGDYFNNNMLRFSTDAAVDPTSQLEANIKFEFYRPKGGEKNFDE
jgi:hypothetical protein